MFPTLFFFTLNFAKKATKREQEKGNRTEVTPAVGDSMTLLFTAQKQYIRIYNCIDKLKNGEMKCNMSY